MKIFDKEGWVYYAQADHMSGEEIGSAIEGLYEAGASNVQVISTVTKKNRSGYVFLIDARPEYRDSVEKVLILETGVTGWHCIETVHRHLRVEYLKKEVCFRWKENQILLNLEAKKAYGLEITLRPEHRSCELLKKELDRMGKKYSVRTCNAIIYKIFSENLEEFNLDIYDKEGTDDGM